MSKLLQIIHVSDMHVGAGPEIGMRARDARRLELAERLLLSKQSDADPSTLDWIERHQTHNPGLVQQFSDFLQEQRRAEPEWFSAPTWLVDSGDVTTFGDSASIDAGLAHLRSWATAAGNAALRTVYGNQDVWPFPRTLSGGAQRYGDIDRRRKELARRPEWDPQGWIFNPLETPVAHSSRNGRIELYALDTVGWDEGYRNPRALGAVDPLELSELQREVLRRETPGLRHFRILVSHHPIAFPHLNARTGKAGRGMPIRSLAKGGLIGRRLGEAERVDRGAGPFFELILSGHTHLRYPGGAFSRHVSSIRQKNLSRSQLQLVGSSVMTLSRSDSPTSNPTALFRGKLPGFDPVTFDGGTARADLLRFSLVEGSRRAAVSGCALVLERIPIISIRSSAYHLYRHLTQRIEYDW